MLPANISDIAKTAAAIAANASSNTGDLFLRMTKFGEWVYGPEDTEVEKDATFAVNPRGALYGWIAWSNEGKRVGEVMVPSGQPMPLKSELPEVDGTWSEQIGLQLKCMSGEDKGLQFLWKANSKGARAAFSELWVQIHAQVQSGGGVVPVVQLQRGSYTHKTYGKIYTPKLHVVRWLPLEGPAEDEKPALELELEQPKRAPEPVPDTAPRRRRRAITGNLDDDSPF